MVPNLNTPINNVMLMQTMGICMAAFCADIK